MAKALRLSRFGLILWLLSPFVVAALLWTQMDPSRGKPRRMPTPPATGEHAPAQGPRPPDAAHDDDQATTNKPAGDSPPTSLVEPESVVQGFVIVVSDAAGMANESSPIYLASNHNGWNPRDPEQKLTKRPDGRWQLVLGKPSSDLRLEFKFTRGDWASVEVAQDLTDIDNRELPPVDKTQLESGDRPVIEFVIPGWADQRKASKAEPTDSDVSVAGGRVERLQVVGGGVAITREIIIWLPPGYDDPANASRQYPVLYMQDGQNIFDTPRTAPAEWRMDETCTELIAAKSIEPLIVVGIPHAGQDRATEYLTTPALEQVSPRGDAYVDFIVRQVLPRVHRVYRVKSGPDHTAIGGSSLGGLISLYAAMKHPEIFGKVLAESPSLRIRGREIWHETFDGFKTGPRVIVLGMGGEETGDPEQNRLLLDSMASFKEWLSDRGIGETVEVRVEPTAGHNEQAWASRLPGALQTLFPPHP